jgi:hypothetical protein
METRYVSKKISTPNIQGLIPSAKPIIIQKTIGPTPFKLISFQKRVTV